MENANSDNQKSRLLIFMMVGLIAVLTALGVTYYQSSRQHDNANSAEAVDADHEPEKAAASENKKQSQKKQLIRNKSQPRKRTQEMCWINSSAVILKCMVRKIPVPRRSA